MAAWAKALECLENPYEGWHLVSPFVVASLCRRSGFQSRWRKDFFKRCGKGPFGKASGLLWTHGMLWVCAQRPASGTKRKYGPDGERCFFLIKRESFALAKAVEFKPFVPAEALRACALTGLHLMAAGDDPHLVVSFLAGVGRDSRALWSEVPSVEEVRVHYIGFRGVRAQQ